MWARIFEILSIITALGAVVIFVLGFFLQEQNFFFLVGFSTLGLSFIFNGFARQAREKKWSPATLLFIVLGSIFLLYGLLSLLL